jgi:dihydroneopterin aldolase
VTAPDRIELRGLHLSGICGVLPHEQAQPQPLEIDVDLHLDLATAGASDDLAETVDYGAVCALIERVVTTERFALLERLATRVADAVLDDASLDGAAIDAVTVAVRKLRPPVPQALATSGVRITRAR